MIIRMILFLLKNRLLLLHELQSNSDKKKFLKTIRCELISSPAFLGKTKDKHI